MVIPFSNTKLRVPKGFQSLLVGLSTEVLRSQPRDIHKFAAEYFDKLLQRRDQGQSQSDDQQVAAEDRYYNNNSFKDEYPVNDPEMNRAASKIQANFRGHKTRREVANRKREEADSSRNQQRNFDRSNDDDEEEEEEEQQMSNRSQRELDRFTSDEITKSSPRFDENVEHEETKRDEQLEFENDSNVQELELTEAEKEEQERAARAIQAKFRGLRSSRKTPLTGSNSRGSSPTLRLEQPKSPMTPTNDVSNSFPNLSSARSERIDLDREPSTFHENDPIDNDDSDRPRLEREPTQLSEDFERHTQIPNQHSIEPERISLQAENDDDDEMNDPNLNKAATRIQASFRGYKTRKELGSTVHSSFDHHHHSSNTKDDHEHERVSTSSVDGHKLHEHDDEEHAATKIQAAYRGYRTRKEMEHKPISDDD